LGARVARTSWARPAERRTTLERPLRVDSQAQHADDDHEHDRQCQRRSHAWILGRGESGPGSV
jgi:hypothetical protein